jgi:hypothetical protein
LLESELFIWLRRDRFRLLRWSIMSRPLRFNDSYLQPSEFPHYIIVIAAEERTCDGDGGDEKKNN